MLPHSLIGFVDLLLSVSIIQLPPISSETKFMYYPPNNH